MTLSINYQQIGLALGAELNNIMKYDTYVYETNDKTMKLEFSLPAGNDDKKKLFLGLLIQASTDLRKEIDNG